jgi:hypothetical protein
MPRKARIDAPGALHHIIIRGIEKKAIFRRDQDLKSFVDRLGRVLLDTSTPCFAWVLLSSHAHFLLRTGVALPTELNISPSAVSKSVTRGQVLTWEKKLDRFLN